MMITKVRGRFEKFDGVIEFDENKPVNTRVEFDIDMASINMEEPQRDDHLRSAAFFDAEHYPTTHFKSKRVGQIDAYHGRLIGDLIIRDITKEVTLDVEYTGIAQSPWGTQVAAFSASTTLNRKDWGLTWNMPLETGGFLVSEQIAIGIDLELVKQPETVPA